MATPVPDSNLKELLAPGRLFEQKYKIIDQLGTGSFAIVVKARHQMMGRDVALKCLKPSVVRARPDVSGRFVTEVQIVSRLRHPNTVTIFDFGRTNQGLAYMVLEYLDGKTLYEAISAEGAFDRARAIRIARQILKSLDEAHAHGIVHRDLKPSNIMLTKLHGEPDFVKVLDFGVAKLLDKSASDDLANQPHSTQFIGTPIYMSPEQVLGKSVTPASDLYSLGLLLFQMLAGEPPIAHTSVAAVVREHLDADPLPFPNLDRLPADMQRIILKATERDPKKRFASVRAFLAALTPQQASRDPKPDPTVQAEVLRQAAETTLAQETSEPDIFSGQNYIEVPKAPDKSPSPARRTSRRTNARSRRARPTSPGTHPTRTTTPAPSLRTDELDLDLESIDRQRRRAERQRRKTSRAGGKRRGDSRSHRRTGSQRAEHERESRGISASVVARRVILLLSGLIAAYVGFVILGAILHGQPDSIRWTAGAMLLATAFFASRFSTTRIVHGDFAQRWLSPVARNLNILCVLIFIAGLFLDPTEIAKVLESEPTWFLDGLSGIPLMNWVDILTTRMADALAVVFRSAGSLLS